MRGGQSAGTPIRVGTVLSARPDSPPVVVAVWGPEVAASSPTGIGLANQARPIEDSDSFRTRAQGLAVHNVFNRPEVTSVPQRGLTRSHDPARLIRDAGVWFGGLGT